VLERLSAVLLLNFELQDIAQAYYNEIIDAQYHIMVQEIMAGFYEIMDESCEFDRIVDLAV
jgi:hypothetical protein